MGSDIDDFEKAVNSEIFTQGGDSRFLSASRAWMDRSIECRYSYHFNWCGLPIIQYPQDIIAMQELIWSVKPDLIIETGVARGGSVAFYASMLNLLVDAGQIAEPLVVGIDIDIRPHNRGAIENSPFAKFIQLIEGSSISPEVFDEIANVARRKQKVLVCLDSNHTHDHVLAELMLYSRLVSKGSYIVVFDTVVELLDSESVGVRPWGKRNNPMTAVTEFLRVIATEEYRCQHGEAIEFVSDSRIDSKLMLSAAPGGYLKRL